MKEDDGLYNDKKMIFAFNREGFLDRDEIFSIDGGNCLRQDNDYENYYIYIDDVSYRSRKSDWDKIFHTNLPLFDDSIGSFFTDYLVYLKTSKDDRATYIRHALSPFACSLPSDLTRVNYRVYDFPFIIY